MAPSFLENIFAQSQAVAQAFVSAAPTREFVVAVLVPEKEYLLRRLAEAEGAPVESYLALN